MIDMEKVEFNGDKYVRLEDINISIVIESIKDNYNLDVNQIEEECESIGISINDLIDQKSINLLMNHLLSKYENN
jgi:hypothetical protein